MTVGLGGVGGVRVGLLHLCQFSRSAYRWSQPPPHAPTRKRRREGGRERERASEREGERETVVVCTCSSRAVAGKLGRFSRGGGPDIENICTRNHLLKPLINFLGQISGFFSLGNRPSVPATALQCSAPNPAPRTILPRGVWMVSGWGLSER